MKNTMIAAIVATCLVTGISYADQWWKHSVSSSETTEHAVVGCVTFTVSISDDYYNPIHINCEYRMPK